MADRPASWRMPTPKEIEKLATEAARPRTGDLRPADPLPDEYLAAIQADRVESPRGAIAQQRVSDIDRDFLRVSCRRCGRQVEIGAADAARLYGRDARLNDVARRLLNATCRSRTGRYEEDGCWPSIETR
jgi:hypothetical protein